MSDNGDESTSQDKVLNNKYFHGLKGLFRLSLWIPTESVGKVIGKKGAVITHIQRATQTEVVVLPIPPESQPLWSPLSVTGEPSRALTPQCRMAEMDDVVAEFHYPRHKIYHGLFYGNHHDAVKRLSADTNVRINVPDVTYVTSSQFISLEGGAEGVFKAVAKFAEVMGDSSYTSYKSSQQGETGKGTDSQTTWNGESKCYERTIDIPTTIVGLLLVRRHADGNNIYQIRSLTGTVIRKLGGEKGGKTESVEVEHDTNETEESDRPSKPGQDGGHETFSISGTNKDDVDLAYTCLSRIIDGEKIYTVITDLKNQKGPIGTGSSDDKFAASSIRGRGGRFSSRGRGTTGEPEKWSRSVAVGDGEDQGGKTQAVHQAPREEDHSVSGSSGGRKSGRSSRKTRGRGARFGRGRSDESSTGAAGSDKEAVKNSSSNKDRESTSTRPHRGGGSSRGRGRGKGKGQSESSAP